MTQKRRIFERLYLNVLHYGVQQRPAYRELWAEVRDNHGYQDTPLVQILTTVHRANFLGNVPSAQVCQLWIRSAGELLLRACRAFLVEGKVSHAGRGKI